MIMVSAFVRYEFHQLPTVPFERLLRRLPSYAVAVVLEDEQSASGATRRERHTHASVNGSQVRAPARTGVLSSTRHYHRYLRLNVIHRSAEISSEERLGVDGEQYPNLALWGYCAVANTTASSMFSAQTAALKLATTLLPSTEILITNYPSFLLELMCLKARLDPPQGLETRRLRSAY